MRLRSSSEPHQPLFTAAVIAAQATSHDTGFRQRDVRFFVELFANWLAASSEAEGTALHNTQIQRYLDALAKHAWAKRVGRTPPRWRLTAEGLVGLLRGFSAHRNPVDRDQGFFIFHFMDVYGGRLKAMAERGGPYASELLALDLAELLDPKRFVARERRLVAHEIARLRARAGESVKISELATERFRKRVVLADVVAEVEARYPYELNNQKPLRELFQGLPEPWQKDELTRGAARRAAGLWSAQEALLVAYDKVLAEL